LHLIDPFVEINHISNVPFGKLELDYVAEAVFGVIPRGPAGQNLTVCVEEVIDYISSSWLETSRYGSEGTSSKKDWKLSVPRGCIQ